MNITLNNSDSANATIEVKIVKSDYTEKVENALKDLRKNAVIAGFRKGMVPKSLIAQRYGISVLVEELNKIVSNSLSEYIRENKLNILGEPLPNQTEQKTLDFGKQDDYEFIFDIGLTPEINVNLTKDDKLTYYTIKVDDDMLNKQIDSYKANYGIHDSDAETVEEKDVVKGLLNELDENGNFAEGGISLEDASLMPSFIKDEAEKVKFVGQALHSKIVFNPLRAYEGHEAELASFLKIKKEEVKNYTGDFAFEIQNITRYKEAELNQELFDKIFEPGTITTEKAFREKVRENISSHLTPESDYKFLVDIRDYLNNKATDVLFPDNFLKRWLLASNENLTSESIEKDYPEIINDLKFQVIKNQLVKDYNIEIDDNDIKEYAKQAVRAQFSTYGMSSIPDQFLESYAQEMLKKEENVRNFANKAIEDKLIKTLKEQVTLKSKKVSSEEFQKLFEENDK